MGWLESEYEVSLRLSRHSRERFCLEGRIQGVSDDGGAYVLQGGPSHIPALTQLSPEAPSLASSIDQLCQVVSVHVKKIKDILTQCFNVLDMFTKLCMLYRFQYGWFQCKMSSLLTVESGLSEPDSILRLFNF